MVQFDRGEADAGKSACERLMPATRFEPALDASGQPIASFSHRHHPGHAHFFLDRGRSPILHGGYSDRAEKMVAHIRAFPCRSLSGLRRKRHPFSYRSIKPASLPRRGVRNRPAEKRPQGHLRHPRNEKCFLAPAIHCRVACGQKLGQMPSARSQRVLRSSPKAGRQRTGDFRAAKSRQEISICRIVLSPTAMPTAALTHYHQERRQQRKRRRGAIGEVAGEANRRFEQQPGSADHRDREDGKSIGVQPTSGRELHRHQRREDDQRPRHAPADRAARGFRVFVPIACIAVTSEIERGLRAPPERSERHERT